MEMSRNLSKFVLTSHITFSIGWLGAVAVFLVLAIVGLSGTDIQEARSAYSAMELSTWFIIVPFSLMALLTGIIQAVGTKWGLFKHYWIIVKLILTVLITILLLLHLGPIKTMADFTTDQTFTLNQETGRRMQLIADSGAAVLALFLITTISIYKPWERTKVAHVNGNSSSTEILANSDRMKKNWKLLLWIGLGALLAFVIIKHLLDGGMNHH
jgi:uncharacterized membrane protein